MLLEVSARLSGDEFTFVLDDRGRVDDAAHATQKILDVFASRFIFSVESCSWPRV